MTEIQRKEIKKLRMKGFGYKAIGKQVNLSTGSVKQYCKRNQLGGYGKALAADRCRKEIINERA